MQKIIFSFPKYSVWISCFYFGVTSGGVCNTQEIHSEIEAMQKEIIELKRQTTTLVQIAKMSRESLQAIYEAQKMQAQQAKKTADQVWRVLYSDMLNRIHGWRSYYQATSEMCLSEDLQQLRQGLDALLTKSLMHPDLRLDRIYQFLGLMLADRSQVHMFRYTPVFHGLLAQLYQEYAVRSALSDGEMDYMFETLAMQLNAYLQQLQVKPSVIEKLTDWR